MNDRLLKKLILKEIRSTLREFFQDDTEEDEDEEEGGGKGVGVAYRGDILTPAEFCRNFGFTTDDPESAVRSLYDSVGDDVVKKKAQGKSFFVVRHPEEPFAGYDEVLIVGDSRREVEDEYQEFMYSS